MQPHPPTTPSSNRDFEHSDSYPTFRALASANNELLLERPPVLPQDDQQAK